MMTKKLISLAATCALAFTAAAAADAKAAAGQPGVDRPLKVLMIGNSFSVCVLKQMPQIAADLGRKLDLCSLYIGGCSLERHAKNLSSTNGAYGVTWNYCGKTTADAVPFAVGEKGRGDLRPMLAGDKWDVVTIQQASHFSWDCKTYQPHADLLVAAIRELAPQAEIVIQQTWSYCKDDKRICNPADGGPGTWGFDQTGMYDRLTASYGALAKAHGFRIIPSGLAVQKFRQARNVTTAKGDVVGAGTDTFHFNYKGEYLQALVWAGMLFGKDVTKVAYAPKNIDADLATCLRDCAAKAVAEGIK